MRKVTSIICLSVAFWLMGLFAPLVEGTHFAFGTISWRFNDLYVEPVLDVNLEFAMRTSFKYSYTNGLPNIGCLNFPPNKNSRGVVDCYTILLPQSAPDGEKFPAEDWFMGRRILQVTIRGTGTDSRRFQMSLTNCCRISSILETNNDKNMWVYSAVNLDTRTASPITTGFPREYFDKGAPINFRIPAVHPLGLPMTYRMATAAESGLNYVNLCGDGFNRNNLRCTGTPLLVDSTTGQLSWTPKTNGLYAAQFIISDGSVFTALDFLLVVRDPCRPQDRNCNHAPYFDPPLNPVYDVYTGVSFNLEIVARDLDEGDTVTLVNNIIPLGSVIRTISILNRVSRFTFTWTPSIEQTSANLCLKARDSRGLFSAGNMCTVLRIIQSPFILVTGIIRDFKPTHADFNKNRQTYTNFVSTTLGSDEKPVFVGGSNHASGVTAASFGDWFHDVQGVNLATLYTITLVQGNNTHPSGRVFSLFDDAFYPIDGKLFNEGVSGHNLFFTYEVHTYIEYLGGESYKFSSGDDMWVFIEHNLVSGLVGTGTLKTKTLDMDAVSNTYDLERGDNYKLDLFFAHRSSALEPTLGVELSNSSTCNAINLLAMDPELYAASTPVKYATFSSSDSSSLGFEGKSDPAALSSGVLRIMDGSFSTESGAVWSKGGSSSATLYKVLNGFLATFTFKTTKMANSGAEGFAFVIQSDSPTARGSEGANLGYSSIRNSIAIEFDMSTSPGKNDPNFQHISLHTAYSGPNDALESPSYYPIGSTYSGNIDKLPFTFDNGTDHRVQVHFVPSPSATWVRVFMNDNIRPVYEAQLNNDRLKSIFSNGAFVGFTSATSSANRAHIDITKWSMVVVPALASKSNIINNPIPVVAGQVGFVEVQLRDACDNAVIAAGERDRFTAELVHSYALTAPNGASITVPVSVEDVGDGKYKFSFIATRAGPYEIRIKFRTNIAFETISNSPMPVTIVPAATFAAQSSYEFGFFESQFDIGARWQNGLICAAVNLATNQAIVNADGDPVVQFSSVPEVPFKTWADSLPATAVFACAIKNRLSQTAAESSVLRGQVYAYLGSPTAEPIRTILQSYTNTAVGLAFTARKTSATAAQLTAFKSNAFDFTDEVSSSYELPNRETITMKARSGSVVGGSFAYLQAVPSQYRVPAKVASSFYIIARDVYGNLKTNANEGTFTYRFIPVLPGTIEVPTYSSPGYEISTFTANVTGIYSLSAAFEGSSVGTDTNVYVIAGPASHITSIATGAETGSEVDVAGSFVLQLRDAEDNAVVTNEVSDVVTGRIVLETDASVSSSLSFNWDASALQHVVTYSTTVAGVYNIEIIINNGRHVGTTGVKLTVTPGEMDASNSVVFNELITSPPTSTGQVGAFYRTQIQTRDRYCNKRGNPHGVVGADFTATGFTTAPTFSYDGDGIYSYEWTVNWPLSSPTITVTIAFGGTTLMMGSSSVETFCNAAPKATYQITGTPGEIGKSSSLKTPTTQVVSNSKAIKYTVSIRDIAGNARPTTSDEVAAALTIHMSGTINGAVVTAAAEWGACRSTGVPECDIVVSATVSGTYNLVVRLASDLEPIEDSGAPAVISHGPTAINMVTVHGDVGGVVAGGVMSIMFTDRDEFRNLRVDDASSNFKIVMKLRDGVAREADADPQAGTGVYNASTVGPSIAEIDLNSDMYEVDLLFDNKVFRTLQITIPAGTESYAAIVSPVPDATTLEISGVFRIGEQIELQVEDFQDLTRSTPYYDSQTLTFEGTSGDGTTPFSVSSSSPKTTNKFSFKFTVFQLGKVEFVLKWGSFISRVNKADDDDNTPTTYYSMVIGAGAMSAPVSSIESVVSTDSAESAIVAGANNIRVTITARDQYFNLIVVDPEATVRVTATGGGTTVGEAVAVWDATAMRYTAVLSVTKSGAVIISAFLVENASVSSLIGGRTTNIVVSPASFSPEHSYVSGSRGTDGLFNVLATVGRDYNVFLRAYDQYNNAITALSEITTNLYVDGTGTMAVFDHNTGNNYLTKYRFTSASTSEGFKINVGRPNDASIVFVRSGTPDSALTLAASAEFKATTTSVDKDVSIIMNIRDTHDSAWVASPTNVDVNRRAVVTTIKAAGASRADTVTAESLHSEALGRYRLNFITSLFRRAGSYQISVTVEGVTIGSILLTVNGGITDPSRTWVQPFPSPYLANDDGSIQIVLRDRYDNNVNDANGEEKLDVDFIVGTLVCDAHFHDGEDAPEYIRAKIQKSITWEKGPVAGLGNIEVWHYKLSFRALQSGLLTMTMKVTINKEAGSTATIPLPCEMEQSLTLVADTGLPHPDFTSYEILGKFDADNNLIAGNQYTIRVQLKDSLNQIVTKGSADPAVRLISFGTASNKQANWLNEDNDASGLKKADLVRYTDFFQQGIFSGQIELVIVPRRANTAYVLHLGLTPDGVKPHARITPHGPQVVKVVPGAPKTLVMDNAPNSVAGVPSSFDAQIADAFSNVIDTTAAAKASIVAQLTRVRSTIDNPAVALDLHVIKLKSTVLSDGKIRLSYTPVWEGVYNSRVTLRSETFQFLDEKVNVVTIEHATCAFATPETPYRCPDNKCVASQAACGSPSCEGSWCECPTNMTRCATGNCVADPSECLVLSPCPGALHACKDDSTGAFTGECRKDASDCPSHGLCPPGLVTCPNGLSCARTLSACPAPPTNTCPLGQARCPDGRCASFVDDCATPKTCPSGKVLCLTDYSCQDAAEFCPSQYECHAPTPFRCWTGDCRASANDCPTRITCPVGYVLCDDNACAPSLSQCLHKDACPLSTVRCPDGTCAENILLCPSQVTCPDETPVLCSDRSCKRSAGECITPQLCPNMTSTCPDGTCSLDTPCSSIKSCPSTRPVLCADRSCAVSASECATVPECPTALPLSCPDGSCRASLTDCPSRTICPPNAPVRCADDSCQQSLDQCAPATSSGADKCPATHITCVTGECAVSQALCPTHVTCPLGTIKCADGRCATPDHCPSPDSVEDCASRGLIQCPVAAAGIACAVSILQCPTGVSCPIDSPVRCLDATCASTASQCPRAPSDSANNNYKPCPDGSWTIDTCPSAVSCPSSAPYKCYDQSCRPSAADCPSAGACSDTAPYRCSNGNCAVRPWTCTTPVDGICNPQGDLPVKCPLVDGNAACAKTAAECPSVFDDDKTGGRLYCPGGFTRCRDGSCAETAAACVAYSCPASFPVVCPNGACVANKAECVLDNGCPAKEPIKCPGVGVCRARLAECPASQCASRGLLACPDGSCAQSCPRAASGCMRNEVRCFDGKCVTDYAQCTSRDNVANSCPGNRPIRCSNGLCAASRSSCPTFDNSVCEDPKKPVLCADGSCRASSDLCPIMGPCSTEGFVRCDDGTCMDASQDKNVCSMLQTCPKSAPNRCKQASMPSIKIIDGLCSKNDGSCFTENGCPMIDFRTQHRCDNGRCVLDKALCTVGTIESNGCPVSSPVKCWDGSCAASHSECRNTNGCDAASPYRCRNGSCAFSASDCDSEATCTGVTCADGSCVSSSDQCKTLMGCDLSTPVRCADGTCKKYDASYRSIVMKNNATLVSEMCAPVVVCPSSAYTRCENGDCVADAADCGASKYECSSVLPYFCPGHLSEDDKCAASPEDCHPMLSCPSKSPILCRDGSCVKSLASCPTSSDPKSSIISGPSSRPSCANKPVTCFDGTCVKKYSDCLTWAAPVAGTDTCSGVRCSDGACLPTNDASACPVIPACPIGSYRCSDGSCSATACPAPVACSNDSEERCADGICRAFGMCPSYDGCPAIRHLSYRCGNRECAAGPEGCAAASVVDPDARAKDRIEDGRRLAERAVSSFNALYFHGNDLRSRASAVLRGMGLREVASSRMTPELESTLHSSLSSNDVDAVTHVLLSLASTDETKSCVTNCFASYKVNATSFVYDPTESSQEYLVAPPASGFRVRVFSGLNIDSNGDHSFYVNPVGESTMINATNVVTYSRVAGPEGYGRAFSFAQTVLSPAVSCSVGSGIHEPFAVPVQIQSNIDRTVSPSYIDVCLARLRRFPASNYEVWECVYNEEQRTSGNPVHMVKPDPSVLPNLVSSQISSCSDSDLVGAPAVYAFIHAPVATSQVYSTNTDTFWRDNVVWIMLGICGAILLIAAIAYTIKRLTRYSGKLDKAKAEGDDLEAEVETMEQLGGHTGRKDDAVMMTANPLSVQLEQVQKKFDDSDRKLQEERVKQQQQDSVERQMVIEQLALESQRNLEELERMKARLNNTTTASGPTRVATTTNAPMASAPAPAPMSAPAPVAAPVPPVFVAQPSAGVPDSSANPTLPKKRDL